MAVEIVPFRDDSYGPPGVRGFLHRPAKPSGNALVLAHGAGSNCQAPLLFRIATVFAEKDIITLRCDLPFRQKRPHGPPIASAREDREGLRHAVSAVRKLASGRVFLGGHSYGGRQATILATEDRSLAAGLLLLSYPLHPPRRPDQLRTAHFPKLESRALFLHGSRDPFGSPAEMETALKLVPAATSLVIVEGAGHELARRSKQADFEKLANLVWESYASFFEPCEGIL